MASRLSQTCKLQAQILQPTYLDLELVAFRFIISAWKGRTCSYGAAP
jgi:hypothetical protein